MKRNEGDETSDDYFKCHKVKMPIDLTQDRMCTGPFGLRYGGLLVGLSDIESRRRGNVDRSDNACPDDLCGGQRYDER